MNTIGYLKKYWRDSKTKSSNPTSPNAPKAEGSATNIPTARAEADTPNVIAAPDVASSAPPGQPSNAPHAHIDRDAPDDPAVQKVTAAALPDRPVDVEPIDANGQHSTQGAASQDELDERINGTDHHEVLPHEVPSFEFSFRKPVLGTDGRFKLQPKRQHSRHCRDTTPQYIPRNLAAQVVIEDFSDPSDPKPKGYMGTIGGMHISRSTVEDYCPCGTGGGHYVTCGHTIVADEACGANCKSGARGEQPFNCPQCRDSVDDVLSNKLSPEEQAKLVAYFEAEHALTIPLCVEYVTRYLPSAKGNIAETVTSIITPGYGRACIAIPEVPHEQPLTLVEIFEAYYSTLEQKTRAQLLTEARLESLVTHEKRKSEDEEAGTSDGISSNTSHSSEKYETPSTTDRGRKKQKNKLETHQEPITEKTRGMKRTAPDDDFPEGDALVNDHEVTPNTKTSNKKLKEKFESHRQPIPRGTHGTKRKFAPSDGVAVSEKPSKGVTLTAFRLPGDASFLPIPARVNTLGPLVRKREFTAPLQDAESNKRGRSLEVLPGSDDEASIGGTKKNRMSHEEFTAMADCGEP